MRKILQFDTPYPIEITKETVGAINLRVKAMKSNGVDANGDPILVPAPIVDLNRISIELELVRRGGRKLKIMRGNLADNLIGMYAQSIKYKHSKASTSQGYNHYLDFNPFAIALGEGDKLVANITVGAAAYDSVRKLDSLIEFETVQVKDGSHIFPVVRSYPVGKDKEFFDGDLGNNVSKVVALTDLAKPYQTSTEAKVRLGKIRANGFDKSFTDTALFVQNQHMFDDNDQTDIEDLVIYDGKPLDNVWLEADFDKPVLESAKILVIAYERI